MKLVGVRPQTPHSLKLLDKDVKEEYLKHKPAYLSVTHAIPFHPIDPASISQTYRKYFEERKNAAHITDAKYAFKAIYNMFLLRDKPRKEKFKNKPKSNNSP